MFNRSEGFALAKKLHEMLVAGKIPLTDMPHKIKSVERIYCVIFRNHLSDCNRIHELNLLMTALNKTAVDTPLSETETAVVAAIQEAAAEHIKACVEFIKFKLIFVDGLQLKPLAVHRLYNV